MPTLCSITSVLLIILTCGIFARNVLKRSWDVLSWRNFFLIGMIDFYFLSAYYSAAGTNQSGSNLGSDESFLVLSVLMPLFVGVFLLSAHWAFKRPALTRLLPRLELPQTGPGILVAALVLLSVAMLAAVLPVLNYFGLILAQLRGQMAAGAMALATFFLIVRKFNPLAWGVFLGTLAAALIVATVGSPDRRLALGVILAIPWTWYFVSWRYGSPAANFVRIGAAGVAGVLAIIIYSPLRFQDVGRMSTGATVELRAAQFLELIQHPTIDPEMFKYILKSDAVPNTLFIIDNYPGHFPYQPFHGLAWMATNPIPRSLWPDKPEALGALLRDQMRAPANLGPGIIGHGWSEGAWIGVIGYALFFGVLVGTVDRAVNDRAHNPYFIAAIGSALGNVVALPRGDTALFLLQIVSGVGGSALVLVLTRVFFGQFVAAFPPLTAPEHPPALPDPADTYSAYADYGASGEGAAHSAGTAA